MMSKMLAQSCRSRKLLRQRGMFSSTSSVGYNLSVYSENVFIDSSATSSGARIDIDGAKIVATTPMDRAAFSNWRRTCATDSSSGQKEAYEVVDLGKALVTPAFVNSHTHLPMAALRGVEGLASAMGGNVVEDLYFKLEASMTAADVRAFARMGCYESLLSCTGFVWEHYYFGHALAGALADTGLAGIVAPTLQDVGGGPGVLTYEQALQETVDLDDDSMLASQGIGAALGPHATDTVSAQLFETVRNLAVARQLPVHMHAAQFESEHALVFAQQGCSPLAWLHRQGLLAPDVPSVLLVHNIWSTRADLALLDQERHVPVLCPNSHMRFAFPARLCDWRRAGLRVAVGTDAAACSDGMDVQAELKLVCGGLASARVSHSAAANHFMTASSMVQSDGLPDSDNSLESHVCPRSSAEALALERSAAFAGSHQERDPSWVLSTVWDTPGSLHPRMQAGRLAPGCLANLVVWDTAHPALWPAMDVKSALCLNSSLGPASSALLVAGKWMGQQPLSSPGKGEVGTAGSWQAALLGSERYASHHAEASERLEGLLQRTGYLKK